MEAHGFTAPRPLPSNRHAWSAFMQVSHIRHYPMGEKHLPNWSDISAVLTLYDYWTADIQGRLTVCFSELMTMESELRKAENV